MKLAYSGITGSSRVHLVPLLDSGQRGYSALCGATSGDWREPVPGFTATAIICRTCTRHQANKGYPRPVNDPVRLPKRGTTIRRIPGSSEAA